MPVDGKVQWPQGEAPASPTLAAATDEQLTAECKRRGFGAAQLDEEVRALQAEVASLKDECGRLMTKLRNRGL